jgi:hypothetical protein
LVQKIGQVSELPQLHTFRERFLRFA